MNKIDRGGYFGLFKIIFKEKAIVGTSEILLNNLEKYSKKYEEKKKDLIRDIFNKREKYNIILWDLSEYSLHIFVNLAKISNLPLNQVELVNKYFEKKESLLILEKISEHIKPSIPEFGTVRVSNNSGTVIFVDITGSTDYFKNSKNGIDFEQNYTGFVIFNAYILLLKTITEITGGKFMEHTGDGALIFYEGRNIIDELNNYNNFNPLLLYFLSSEYIKKISKEKFGLLSYEVRETNPMNEYVEPSLVHIGASYGDIYKFQLGNVEKLVSPVVWEAAEGCKIAKRYIKYEKKSDYIKYKELPIKT